MIDTLASILDWFGILVFATTGALVASRKQMDIVGFLLLGTATGVGGGTIRDVLLGLPVFWIAGPRYLIACVAVSAATFFLAHIPESRLALLLRFDAIGMALFAVTGADKTLAVETGPDSPPEFQRMQAKAPGEHVGLDEQVARPVAFELHRGVLRIGCEKMY